MKILALVLAAAAFGATAADKPCSAADAAAAEKAIDRVVNWQQMQKTWQDYRHCDQGSVADVYTDALLRLTVEWKHVDAMAAAMQKDAAYRDFVYTHLKSPAAKDDYDAIYSRTKASCPKGLDGFCTELREAIKPPGAAPADKPLTFEPLKPLK